ncbi:MAG: YitT family protein [Clostridia bacterium]|nr:YitT family protein [Clostridia bacterium]
MEKGNWKKEIVAYALILLGACLYAVGTVFFIFPNGLLLGGTSGISVILNAFLPFSPGTILTAINVLLIVVAFFVLGKDMAIKSFVGSIATTATIALTEKLFVLNAPVVENDYLSALCGAAIIAVASGVMFYVDSSSGGTDIVALIVKKYSKLEIGKALLCTDVLIVIVGGILSGWTVAISSFLGLLIKTLGIDLVIRLIKKCTKKDLENTAPADFGAGIAPALENGGENGDGGKVEEQETQNNEERKVETE